MPTIQQFDTTMRLLQRVLDLRTANQEVIGSNIANAETPGYEARSFSFEDQLRGALSANSLHPVATLPNHIPIVPTELEQVSGAVTVTRDTAGIGDRNTVSVDQEMINLSRNQLLYEAAVTMLNKKMSLVKYAAGGGA